MFHARTKYMKVCYHFIRPKVLKEENGRLSGRSVYQKGWIMSNKKVWLSNQHGTTNED